MNDDPVFRGFSPPEVPDGLREAALAAARAAFDAPVRRDVWAQLLSNPAARLAWAASIAILAIAHALLPRGGQPEAPSASVTLTRPDPELATISRLPRIDEHALPALEGGRS
jgi:hypothetical protein